MANQPDPAPAVLFDIDGTLVDSNYLHIHAWCRAFDEVGIAVETWRIHRSIGMDGARLFKSLSGDADDDMQERAKDLHLQYFKDSSSLLRRLPGSRELLEQVRTLGLQVVLASSAGEDELSLLRGVLDCDDLVSAVTSVKRMSTPTTRSMSVTRCGTSSHALALGCLPSAFSVAAYHAASLKMRALKPFSTIRVTCLITSAAPASSP